MRTGSGASGFGVVRSTVPLRRHPPKAMVEQDGIEPTTSCLQSTRSTD